MRKRIGKLRCDGIFVFCILSELSRSNSKVLILILYSDIVTAAGLLVFFFLQRGLDLGLAVDRLLTGTQVMALSFSSFFPGTECHCSFDTLR